MKKPKPEDFLLSQKIIAWCASRDRELDALSYRQFLPKIWTGLSAIVGILYIVVLIIEPAALNCSGYSCLTLGEILTRLLGFFGVFACLFFIAVPLALMKKWAYRFKARQDTNLQCYQRYQSALKRYHTHLENRSTADSPAKKERSNVSEEDVLLAHDIASKKEFSNVSDDDIVSAYGDFISENHQVDLIWDVSKLPYPKEIIKDALIRVYARETTAQDKQKAIGVCFTYLSQFQEGVGDEDLGNNLLGIQKLLDAEEAGHINDEQLQTLLKEEHEKTDKNKVLYEKFDKLVQKEMIEILPEEFLRKTAARKVVEGIIKARKEKN